MPSSPAGESRPRAGDILVVGGYGDVGAHVSARLATRFPGGVRIAGRRLPRAQALATRLGAGTRAVEVDLADPATLAGALAGVATVAACVDDAAGHLLGHAIERGLAYLDITADRALVERARNCHANAAATGARAVIGIGLAPGLTNLMAAAAAARVGHASDVTVGVLVSLDDEFGPQALDFMLEAASRRFPEPRAGSTRSVRPYSEPRRVWFGTRGYRDARWFPFPDQFAYRATLGVDAAATILALDPPWVNRAIAMASALRLTALARWAPARRALGWLLLRLRRADGHAAYAVSASATSTNGSATATLEGVGESTATAAALAVATARAHTSALAPGVWLPEQTFDAEHFLGEIAADGAIQLSWADPPPRPS